MKTYGGGCHCKAVQFEVDLELKEVMECNCSICSKRGWLLTFAPESQFRLLKGEEMLTVYHFNKKMVHHTFCKVCGTASFGRGSDGKGNNMVAINARCLDDADLSTLTINTYNGKDI